MSESVSPHSRSGSARLPPVFIALLVVGIIGYSILLMRHISPCAGGSDSSGYLNNARLLSRGELYISPRVLPGPVTFELGGYANVPLGFLPRPDGLMAPTYPTGYSLQLILAAWCVGWNFAATLLNVLTALASGFLLFALCRLLGLPAALSLGGVGLLWVCPLFMFSALQAMSDLSAVGWSMAVLFCACRARGNWKWSLLGGAAMGIAVLVRPTNLLLSFPILVAVGYQLRSLLAVIAGGLPGAIFLGYYNWRLYGSPVITGYNDVERLLGPEFLSHNLAHFAHWIPLLLSPLIVFALAAPFAAAGRQRAFAVLATWGLVLVGFYAFYFHSGETWWYLRFILPAFPVVIIATLIGLVAVWEKAKPHRTWASVVLAALFCAAGAWQWKLVRQLDVLNLAKSERSYPDAAAWAKENLPPESVILCMQVSGAFFYYTNFLLFRWDQISPEKYGPLLQTVARLDRPLVAALFPFESPEALEKIGGHWTKLTTVGQVTFWKRQQ